MAGTHDTHPHAHHGPTLALYIIVAVLLGIFTAFSFIINGLVISERISNMHGLFLILGAAVCKAALVTLFFMHVKYDWGKLYFMIVPALILGVMMMLVLLPDMVLAWHR